MIRALKAKGTRDEMAENMRQIAIRFRDDQFEKIATAASEAGLSFAQYVRSMVDLGMAKQEMK